MYEDFILRVRKARTSPELSSQIRACRDYIELHLEEELPLELLAEQAGYAPFYLKQEMNCTVGEYVRTFQQVTGLTPRQWREQEGRPSPPAAETTKRSPG